ncbi:MAG TPA: UxaA family hydrolase, partial [Candidatus Avipropionibacterium avicola]|nr:UxaA family hydrolase [Candidatus Avipropionibacterium avicola]
RVGWHGHSAEGNPSGGNILRGLHNIVLKSLGAARKKDPALRLDGVIQYGEPVDPKGFLFMDSPGNDLESVAGQIGSGCTMIYFTTGNGSITNFPFVPTIKFVTTTERFELLHEDMDVNAGRYLDGEDFEDLAHEIFDLTVDVASGRQTAGERAGHSQVQIWRDWAQTGPVDSPAGHGLTRSPGAVGLGLPGIGLPGVGGPADDPLSPLADTLLDGVPLPVPAAVADAVPLPPLSRVVRADGRTASQAVALVLPTSLCSGQIAVRIADRAGRENWHGGRADRTVALPHTEGCGSSSGDSEEIFTRTMINHLRHPNTGWALLLEHGCEKTHNAHFRVLMEEAGVDPASVGYASIQADGGITAATEKVKQWFVDQVAESGAPRRRTADWQGVVLGLCGIGTDALDEGLARTVTELTVRVLASGGSVVLSSEDPLLSSDAFAALVPAGAAATLGHGQRIETAGLHLMNGAGSDRLETLTGLGGTGAEVIVALTPGPGQRYTPVVRIAAEATPGAADADLVVGADVTAAAESLAGEVGEVLQGERTVTAHRDGDEGFQFTRGLLGVSL